MSSNTIISLLSANNTINDMRLKLNEIIYDLSDNVLRIDGTTIVDGDVFVADGDSFVTPPKEDLTDGGNF